MNLLPHRSRQPAREVWPRDRLVHEQSIALGLAIDKSTAKSYNSALNSYLAFVRSHELPVEPTPQTLSFFTVYMSHHINPKSVASYLSGISQQLEPFFPGVRAARKSPLVERTLKGCMRRKGVATKRKRALTLLDLSLAATTLRDSRCHDDLLFLAMLFTGFFSLLRLGEMTFPDDKGLQNWRKVTKRSSVVVTSSQYEFHLPSHKADRFFEGNRIIVRKDQFNDLNPLAHFQSYLSSRDRLFPLSSPLWLTSSGSVPNRHFFITRLRLFFDAGVGGQ
jgi:hypothetical protein